MMTPTATEAPHVPHIDLGMRNHSQVLVPVEAWAYQSPEIINLGKRVDIGLIAEALIYYDHVCLIVDNERQCAELLHWFISQGAFNDFVELIEDGTISFFHHAFDLTPLQTAKDGEKYFIYGVQSELQATSQSYFLEHVICHKNVRRVIGSPKDFKNFLKAAEGKVIEAKAEEYGDAVLNARRDCVDPYRCTLVAQALLDHISPMMGLPHPIQLEAKTFRCGTETTYSWNVDFEAISKQLGSEMHIAPTSPFLGASKCNQILRSAQKIGSDLFLESPMSSLVGDKLTECEKTVKTKGLIDQLVAEVEFPDIRHEVNAGHLKLSLILEIRKKASKRFRGWLQNERERDRNAIIAYHLEVAKESGVTRVGRRLLSLFGVLSSPAVGTVIGGTLGGPVGAVGGAVIGTTVGETVKYLFDIGANLGGNWRPVVFGDWARDRIEKELRRTQR